jgi:phospholipid/cholesterol/gamma-HCH transport system substrate-binding protein
METRARYLTIGLFTLAVITAGFAFVFWLYSSGGFREQSTYKIQFDGPVSGLLIGSGVLFNGIRVGEVTDLKLSPDNPKQVMATIAIDPATPVRADTVVGMDFQGLTGAPVVVLSGGSATSPAVKPENGVVPTLAAAPDTGQSMTQAARTTLQKLDTILTDNADPLHAVIENLKKFSDALARNSDKVDTVVAGLERMTGGAAASGKLPIYSLHSVHDFPPLQGEKRAEIIIPEPAALMSLSSDKILMAKDGSEGASIPNAQWSDNLPVLFQAKTVESFENSGYFQAVSRPLDGLDADEQVVTEIRTFRIVTQPKPAADVAFSAKILRGGKIAATRVFEAEVPIAGTDSAIAVAGLDKAFQDAVKQLVEWAAENTGTASAAAAAPAEGEVKAPEENAPADAPQAVPAPDTTNEPADAAPDAP